MKDSGRRIDYIDGLRGVAISTVFAYHLYGLGPAAITPYHDHYANNPVVEFGWMGVELFFLISGYVISLTIERCTCMADFLYRRWLRLFPVMLTASLLLFTLDRILELPGRFSNPRTVDILPGILFVSPSIIHAVTRLNINSLDDTFWSLYVEVTFYITFGFLYFSLGWRRAVLLLILISAIFPLLSIARVHVPSTALLIEPLRWIGAPYFVWFASGALFYKAGVELSARMRCAAIATGIFAAAIQDGPFMNIEKHLILGGLVLFFALAQVVQYLRKLIAARPLLFVGHVSYALYLIHSNLAVGITIVVAKRSVDPVIASGIAIILVVITALGITKLEPWLRRQLSSGLKRLLYSLSDSRAG